MCFGTGEVRRCRMCLSLTYWVPELHSKGNYWIDPNEGIPDDAVYVFCDFEINATCIYPQNKTKVSFVICKRRNLSALSTCRNWQARLEKNKCFINQSRHGSDGLWHGMSQTLNSIVRRCLFVAKSKNGSNSFEVARAVSRCDLWFFAPTHTTSHEESHRVSASLEYEFPFKLSSFSQR